MEHGLDARHARLHLPGADPPPVPPPRDDVLDGVRLLRELRAADLARRGGARQGLAAETRSPAIGGSSWPRVRALCATCGPIPASNCCSWARSSPRAPSGARRRSLDWWLLDSPDHRGVTRLVTDLNRVYRETTALWSQGHRSGGLRLDRRRRRRGQRLLVPAVWHRRLDLACVANFAPVPHEQLPARPAPRGPLGGGCQHRRRVVLRVRGRQLRRRRCRRPAIARAAHVRDPAGPTAGSHLVALDRIKPLRSTAIERWSDRTAGVMTGNGAAAGNSSSTARRYSCAMSLQMQHFGGCYARYHRGHIDAAPPEPSPVSATPSGRSGR